MKSNFTYPYQFLRAIIILLALLWLTMGASLVYMEQQEKLSKISSRQNIPDNFDHKSCPFESEENTDTVANCFIEDYLQTDFDQFTFTDNALKHNKHYSADVFVNFHAESVSPPPECLS